LLLFEKPVDLVHEHAPGAKICFNTTPADTAEAYGASTRKINIVPQNRSLAMPKWNSDWCAEMLLAEAAALPLTKRVLGI
jgi:hypothetical protein